MSDVDRWEFIQALDRSNVTLPPKELKFVADLIDKEWKRYTPKMRIWIDNMIDKYQHRVEW